MTKKVKRRTGIIVLAHGSKHKRANDGLRRVVTMLRDMRRWEEVEGAFLQFAAPTLTEAAGTLVKNGCTRIVVLPLLLFTGQHVTADIPAELEQVKGAYAHVEFVYAGNIGPDPRVAHIAADRIEEALRG